jgi:hypothetical protein
MRAELMKVRWPLTLAIVSVAPVLALLMRGIPSGQDGFKAYYMGVVVVYGWIFYPIVSGVLAALVCRTEHATGGWKQLLALPVRRTHVYLAKYVIVAGLLALSQLLVLAGMWAVATFGHVGAVPWARTALGLLAGWVAVLPLAALQLWTSTRWRAFGAPLALNVALTFPAIFAVQSEQFDEWYPWGLPVVGMMSSFADKITNQWVAFDARTFLIVIVGGFAVWFLGGMVHFVRGDVVG